MRSSRTVLAVSLVALAVVAIAAPGASAAGFMSGYTPVKILGTAEGSHTIDGAGSSMTCSGVTMQATLEGFESPELKTSSVSYSGCTVLGISATVNMNGCGYVLHAGGLLDIVCPGGSSISFGTAACTVTVPPQTALNGATLKNIDADTAFTATINATGIKYTASGLFCPVPGAGSNGVYTNSSVAFKGEPLFGEDAAIGWEALAPPVATAAPVGGGVKLSFVGQALGAKKQIKITNSGPNVPAMLGNQRIQVPGGAQEEKDFAIVGGTCVMGAMLNRGESCTVSVEFKSGTASKKAEYRLKYGTRLNGEIAELLVPVES